MDSNTTIFNVQELREELIKMTLDEVIEALEFKGYKPLNQLVGYLKTGDEKYITSFNDSRKKISAFDRSEVLLVLLKSYIGK